MSSVIWVTSFPLIDDFASPAILSSAPRHSLRLSFTPEKLAGLNAILSKRRVFSPEDIRNIATYFKLQESKCRIWFKENGARLRRQACSVRILPDTKKGSSDKRKSYILKVRKRSAAANPNLAAKEEKERKHDDGTSSSTEADVSTMVSNAEENDSNAEAPENVDAATPASEDTFDEHDVGLRLVFAGRKASSDTEAENSSVLSEATAIKVEPTDAHLSGSDESKGAADGDSSAPASGLATLRTRDRFFSELPFDKKILLLKRTQHLSTASSTDAHKLAAELGAPFRSVYSWLKSKTIRQLRTWSKRLSREKTAILDGELAASQDALSEERALLLSYELDVSVCAIRRYFERKMAETKTEDGARAASAKVESASAGERETEKPTDQLSSSRIENTLSPRIVVPPYVPATADKCTAPSSGIWLRPRPASNASKNQSGSSPVQPSGCNDSESLRKRRFVLASRQRKLLMRHFQKTPFITPADASALSSKLGLPVKAVQLWFHRKRNENKQTGAPEVEGSSVTSEIDNQLSEEMPNI